MDDDLLNHKVALPPVPDRHGTPTISLALLLDFSIQNTSHEITILSELLPKKKEADRKISVVQFAHSTRMMFVKLLAIVKWLRVSKKFESLSAIRYFLQQQAAIFEESANRLVTIARTELKFARLPRFQVPYAIDSLVTGSFPRLPLDIKDRFVQRPQLTPTELALTLRRLNVVIMHHIEQFSQTIASRISSIVVKNGMVIIKVTGEFELCMTLLSEAKPLKWTLLNIKILTECSQIALGQKLVHPLQVNTLHEIIQEKLSIGSNPLYESYVVMHVFSQSLQLEVLYYQATRLRAISPYYVRVDEYNPLTQVLVISYWLASNNKKKTTSDYRITIYVDPNDICSPLKTSHRPLSLDYPLLDCDDENLCLSRLLNLTILRRSQEYLMRVKNLIESISSYPPVSLTGNSIPTLTYPLVFHGTRYPDESLEIAVDSYRGTLVCQIRRLGRVNDIVELENELNGNSNPTVISRILDRLRVLVMIERFNKALYSLQVRSVMNPAVVEGQIMPLLNKLKNLPSDRRILQFNREEQYYLVVTFMPDSKMGVVLGFYLASVNAGRCYMMELDPVELAKLTPIPTVGLLDNGKMEVDEKLCDDMKMRWTGTQKQLQAAIAAVDDRLLFLRISEELDKRGIRYHPLEIEPIVGGNVLRISNSISKVAGNFGIDPRYCEDFFANLHSCSLRLDLRLATNWPFECTMVNCPLFPEDDDVIETANGPIRRSGKFAKSKKRTSCTWILSISSQNSQLTMSESASSQILERLSIYCHVYAPVKRFSVAYNAYLNKFCKVRAFTYHKLVLAYGDDRDLLMILSWRPQIGKSMAQYTITFAQCQNSISIKRNKKRCWNPHVIVSGAINDKFNKNSNLVALVEYLANSWKSLSAIYQFSRTKLHSTRAISQILSINAAFPVEMKCYLSVINERQLRLAYGSSNIEFLLLRENNVAVRDTSAMPTTNTSRAMPGTSPMPQGGVHGPSSSNLVNGFEMFWRSMMPNRVIQIPTSSITTSTSLNIKPADGSYSSPQPVPTLRADSPYHVPPKSFPSVQSFNPSCNTSTNVRVHSPVPLVSQRMTLSVPPMVGVDTAGHEQSSSTEIADSQPHENSTFSRFARRSIFVPHAVLEKAMTAFDSQPSSFDNYLYGLNYLSRLYVALDASRRATGPSNLPLRDLQFMRANLRNDVLSLSTTIFTYMLPTMNVKEPSLLRMTFFLNEASNFQLSVKLEYSGIIVPSESDIYIFARYFEKYVCHVFNEMTALSFIVSCRISEPSIFASFAQIMRAQLEPSKDITWVPSLQLTIFEDLRETAPGLISQRRLQCGIAMNESCKRLLFSITVRNLISLTPNINGSETYAVGHDRRQYTFIYNVLSNEVSLQKGYNLTQVDESDVAAIMHNVNNAAKVAGAPCSIWVCVRKILEKLTFTASSYTAI